MPSEIQLFYFPIRAKASFIRMMLHMAGQKFDDNFISMEEWPAKKSSTPYGQLPYMIYKGKTYGQSMAIANYLAKKFGYFGKTPEDGLRIDEVCQVFEDIRPFIRDWFFSKDDEKAKVAKTMTDEAIPRVCGFLEKLLADNSKNTGFFVGDSATLADLLVYDGLTTLLNVNPEALSNFPKLTKLRTLVEAIPALKKYLADRAKTPV